MKIESENPQSADNFLEKLEMLQNKQDLLTREINQLRKELKRRKMEESRTLRDSDFAIVEVEHGVSKDIEPQNSLQEALSKARNNGDRDEDWNRDNSQNSNSASGWNLEKFIGENLINKIGIVITIIGVAIGVKYSIDHDLISPVTRIVLGYLSGLALLGVGIRLKAKYENYSAVLVSGSLAVVYYITYAAYAFYALFPQLIAFACMVLITGSAVYAALKYNQQVIALIGSVGAYAIPFLLSNEQGNPAVLFSYIAIINIGILIVSIKRNWDPLYYTSFAITWLIYFSWYGSKYQSDIDFKMALFFLSIFFAIFYLTFLLYNVRKDKQFVQLDIILILTNSALFYGLGYAILKGDLVGEKSLGLFTLLNALIHFSVSLFVYYRKIKDKNLLYLLTGLALIYVTIAVPVQLDGNWVTLFWAGEIALLFWIGRSQKAPVYEVMSYPLIVLTFFSLIHNWSVGYSYFNKGNLDTSMPSVFNIYFLTSAVVVFSLGFINYLHRNKKYPAAFEQKEEFLNLLSMLLPFLLLFTLYGTFRNELAFHWDRLLVNAVVKLKGSWNQYYSDFNISDLVHLKTIWIINYSLLFFSALSYLNIRKYKNRQLGEFNLAINLLTILIFLTVGLFYLGILRDNELGRSAADHLQHSFFNHWIRYISFCFLAVMFSFNYLYIRQDFMTKGLRMAFDFVLYAALLWIASSELISWMKISGSAETYKLGLSILWGAYSLVLIVLGI